MKIKVNIQQNSDETEVVINCPSEDKTVRRIIDVLHTIDTTLICWKDEEKHKIHMKDIVYIESVNRKTFLYTRDQTYETEKRLYELEEYLRGLSFFRVSKAMIINLQRVKSLRPEVGSRLIVTMDTGERVIVSRQYAGQIKEALEVL